MNSHTAVQGRDGELVYTSEYPTDINSARSVVIFKFISDHPVGGFSRSPGRSSYLFFLLANPSVLV